MNIEISIARRETYTTDGAFDFAVYEVQVRDNPENIQTILLDELADLHILRKAIDDYITRNNIQNPSL